MEIIDHVIIDGNAVYEIDDQCMNQPQATQRKILKRADLEARSSSQQKYKPLYLLFLMLIATKD